MPQIQIPQAHSISDMIDDSIVGVTGQYQFPVDRPKYYTTINIEQYGTQPSAPGSWGSMGLLADLQAFAESTGDTAIAYAIGLLRDAWANYAPDVTVTRAAPAVTTGSIVLPLPVQLLDVHKVRWDEKSIVPWVQVTMEAIGLGTGPERQALGLFGLAPNYFQTMLFDRPEYKRHELTFRLAPRNFEEADRIADIIMVLNNAMSPGLSPGNFIFTFPNVVRVAFVPNAGFLFKFKPCVIEALSINYAGSGGKKAFYHDPLGSSGGQGLNPPESVEFTMMLCEIEYWIQGQFNRANA